MLNNNFLRRWPTDFDLLEPPRGFGADFHQEFERIKQNHLRRMAENFGYVAPFRSSFFKRERNFFERRSDFLGNFEPIRDNRFCLRNPTLNSRVSDTHRILVDCTGYSADSLKVSISEDKRSLTVSGREGKKNNTCEDFTYKEFKKVFSLPENADTLNISSSLKSNGLLILDVPLVLYHKIKLEKSESDIKVCENERSKKQEEKTVTFEEKPLDSIEEQKIRTKITEESYYKKVVSSAKNFDYPLIKDEILEKKDKMSLVIPIDSDNDSQTNYDCYKNKYVTIPVQIVNRKQN